MKYARSILDDVEGYVPGEQPRVDNLIKLNTNENPYPPSPAVHEAIANLSQDAARKYPDPVSLQLRQALADRYGYPGQDWVIVGNGMDELLALALRTFVDPGDTVLTPYPTYSLYETLTLLHGASLQYEDLGDGFQLSDTFFDVSGRLCFLPRPNAPTGVASSRADVERLCESFTGIVIIDEAYADFGDDDCMDFPSRIENALVMRTFSKSFSLAGLRVGFAVAQPEIITEFLKTKDSYNLNAASQAGALAAINDYEGMRANAARIRATRARLATALRAMGFSVPESQANFVLAFCQDSPSAKRIFEELRTRNILVRYFDVRNIDNALRITVGTDSEIDALLDALKEITTG